MDGEINSDAVIPKPERYRFNAPLYQLRAVRVVRQVAARQDMPAVAAVRRDQGHETQAAQPC
jgi:hypothetical protein